MENLKPEQQAQISTLKTKLQSLVTKLKAINEQGRLIAADPTQLFLFKGMYKKLDNYFDGFNETWEKIIDLLASWGATNLFPLQHDIVLQKTIERYYYEASATYEEHMNPTPHPPSTSTTTAQSIVLNDSRTVRARLPQINLPSFDGMQSRWPLFRDTYCSLIHEEPSLSDIEKFLFLVSCLSGSALTLIKGIEVQAANYAQAWNLLNTTFNDKRRLANNYLKSVLEFVPFRQRPTCGGLKQLLATVAESIDSYKQLKIPNGEDFILFSLVLRCLDPETRRSFEKKFAGTEFPTYKNLIDFLKVEWRSLELSSEDNAQRPGTSNWRRSPQRYAVIKANKSRTSLLIDSTTKQTSPRFNRQNNDRVSRSPVDPCVVCKVSHVLFQCERFRKGSPSERHNWLKGWKGCTNCLSNKHTKDACRSVHNCRLCSERHHTWLHLPQSETSQVSAAPPPPAGGVVLGSHGLSGEVLLGTAVIEIYDHQGTLKRVRAVVDCGSQHSFMTSSCSTRLGLTILTHNECISGIGQSPLSAICGKVRCVIQARSDLQLQAEPLVVSCITADIPHTSVPAKLRSIYNSYVLADKDFWKPSPVEFLLGADLFYDIITGSPIVIDADAPRLLPSVFGFIVGGPSKAMTRTQNISCLLASGSSEIKEVMERFWTIEEVPKPRIVSDEDRECEAHFVSTHYRLPSGRFVVSLPLKDCVKDLNNPRGQAMSRFLNLEYKFKRNASLKRDYQAFMREYISLEHMSLAPTGLSEYIVPHHAVVKTVDDKQKIRVVFDASCCNGKYSLNDCMYTGPKLQLDIADVISNFRTHAFVFTGDIVKMYRQIMLREPDRKYQHVFWRFDGEQIQEYQLNTVTYGQRASPFLAQRVIKQLVNDDGSPFPRAAQALTEDTYVDDIATGAETIDELIQLKNELIKLLHKGCFELSKWSSNAQALLDTIDSVDQEQSQVRLSDNLAPKIKVLGIYWDPREDVFSYDVSVPPWNPTKRAILSTVARIYDPLGYICPIVFHAKCIVQEMWRANLGWDDKGSHDISTRWRIFIDQLNLLSQVRICRLFAHRTASYMLVGFSDASLRGYSAVLYLRTALTSSCLVSIVKAKTKLAPIKPVTIPRLELCAALLLVRLFLSCKPLLGRLNISKFKFFTDSQIVLNWLSTSPEKLHAFVAHRVVEIQEHTPYSLWSFVKSQDNPADCASRGLLPADLLNHQLWWHGPDWISSPENTWPACPISVINELPELATTPAAVLSAKEEPTLHSWISGFSSFNKLVRSVAYIMRFFRKLHRISTPEGPISISEYRGAKKKLIQIAQERYHVYPGLLAAIPVRFLRPFQDEDGLFRVGGRLRHSSLPEWTKHPYLLPADHHITKLLVDYYHISLLHAGSETLKAVIQSQYWIVGARKIIRQCIFKCLKCYKATRLPQVPLMGDLPPCRLKEGNVFSHVGVDLAGPFIIKESSRRNAALGKAYLCLFLCMTTRAVHLEVVSACSTEAFLASLARFIARRGKPSQILSDCGTNFVGAANRLRDILQCLRSAETKSKIIEFCVPQDIRWDFNPPYAPHFGGSWEAAIKSCKTILYKVIGDTPLRFEELTTIFCRIEGILNSRLLAPCDPDPDKIDCLTPGHFLIGKAINAPPEFEIDSKINIVNRWHIIQQRTQHFWNRWRLEYLHQLQQRKKWLHVRPNLEVNDLVIVKEPKSPVNSWPLARVQEVHAGKDGVVRVVTIRTSTGCHKRPVAKLVPLTPVNQHIKN